MSFNLLELLPNGTRREWSFVEQDVYGICVAGRIGFGGTMLDAVLKLPRRSTAKISYRDLPELPELEGGYRALADKSDDAVGWKDISELHGQ